MYSLAFSAAPAAPVPGANSAGTAQVQQGELLQHQMAPAAAERGVKHSLSQQQPASPAECTDMRSRSAGIIVEHPWRDPVVAALRAGRTPPLPTATATSPGLDGPGAASGQLPDGFETAVATVLDVLGEAVRVRCQCIDEHQAGPADVSAHAQQMTESTGMKPRHSPSCRCSAYLLKPSRTRSIVPKTSVHIAPCSSDADSGFYSL